jgi:hypothetical protein
MGLEDKSQSGTMAKVAAAFSPAAVGKKVSAAFQREGDASHDSPEPPKPKSGKKGQPSPEFYVSVARPAERKGTPPEQPSSTKKVKADSMTNSKPCWAMPMLDRQGQLTKATQLMFAPRRPAPRMPRERPGPALRPSGHVQRGR